MSDLLQAYLTKANSGDPENITSTDFPGNKRGLDVSIAGGTATLEPVGFIAGKLSIVSVDNLTWTALPTVALADRQTLSIQNRTGQDLWVNWLASDLDATTKGWLIPDQYERSYPVQDGAILYCKSTTSACDVLVEELKK